MEGAAELRWDIEPHNGKSCFFTQATYEKYSLAPTLAELMLLANKVQKAPEKSPEKEEKAPISQPTVPERDEAVRTSTDIQSLPEPRVPYPRSSSLSLLEQRTYVQLMIKFMGKKCFKPHIIQLREYEHYQFLKSKASIENAEFQKFLQNSARNCMEDYNCLSPDAQLYTQEVLKASRSYVKNYPEFYFYHEVTSMLGGKIIPDLTLKLEKCLLALGEVHFAKITFPNSELVLPTSYTKVSSKVPPSRKAEHMHTSVSSDPNATKLAAKYCPQVVMTSQALYALLNNHGNSYNEQWEIPFRVNTINDADGKTSKVVYIDSPLPKKEMSIREKSQMFHEVSLDLFMTKKTKVLLDLMHFDKESESTNTCNEDSFSRTQNTSDNMELDFENDVTELETFGTNNISYRASQPVESEPTPKPISISLEKSLMNKLMMEKQIIHSTNQENKDDKERVIPENKTNSAINFLWSDSEDTSSFKGFESDELKDSKRKREKDGEDSCSDEGSTEEQTFNSKSDISLETEEQSYTKGQICSDSEDEQLVIDVGDENKMDCSKTLNSYSENSVLTSPPHSHVQESQKLPKQSARRLSKEFDPVGQILKMQTQLLKPGAKKMQEPNALNQERSGQLPAALPIINSVAEPVEDTPKKTLHVPPDRKPLLPTDLLTSKDDPTEYTCQPDDNCTYKLFSLDDMLLLIRSRIHRASNRVRTQAKAIRKHLPILILAKMDYQYCYGVERLTESEVCRLWTESVLNSGSLLYVAHIDALTSKFFMLEEISSEALKDRLQSFNPANSLVMLRHILKLVTGRL
ncbi:little elongation complex subunit 2 isoform X1 [Pelobates cultripes]|uniref:Little elongation complex subunit 2 isoform X1 n=1 Tax=Pelobates cultripes TaxID=61616 RepID=A0AAD1VXS4_PELCU|nr:little elongation complex subunit 2 isoform X1 [Pelobates cultripes]